jgi:hypothetical protein
MAQNLTVLSRMRCGEEASKPWYGQRNQKDRRRRVWRLRKINIEQEQVMLLPPMMMM